MIIYGTVYFADDRGQRQRRYDIEGHGGRVVAAEHGLKATD
jgi:hypothetical protein